MAVNAYRQLLAEFPHLVLVLAPRHVDRLEEVKAAVTEAGFEISLRSRGERVQRGHVFILDTVGELADCYAAADVAFVGGSLIKRGGHNLLEPVLRGTPVLFGPFVMNFLTGANLVEKAGLGQSIADQDALAPAVAQWLRDSDGRRALPGRVEEYLGGHRGAASRMAAAVKSVLREGNLS
jgi:3-deoxy-D-manno-octulosonic-acid transferase